MKSKRLATYACVFEHAKKKQRRKNSAAQRSTEVCMCNRLETKKKSTIHSFGTCVYATIILYIS